MIQTPCVIFAGGKSSRMKEDKSLLPFASYSTLTEYQYQRLCKIFDKVYIVTKDTSKFPFQANFLKETSDIYAPTVGFVHLLETLQCEKAFVLSVDSPFITQKEIEELFQYDNETYDATIAKTPQGIQPLCGIYHKSMLPVFKTMLKENNHKLTKTLLTCKTQFVSFSNTQPFMNLNYPEEYKEALKLSYNL
jgi:molybdopterin-guanine dinucleotide biosynthesis protein A